MRSRVLVTAGAAALAAVAAVVWFATSGTGGASLSLVTPNSSQVAQAESLRDVEGARVHDVALTAAPERVDLGGRSVETWAFNGTVPGPAIRVRAGDVVRARVTNHLPQPLTVHWHGIALRNDMDGVPGVTQDPIAPGASFTYEFTAPTPGTYWYHPHTGTQLDRGLYGALIVEDPSARPGRELTLMLDDWIDGTGQNPDQALQRLRQGGMPMPGHTMPGHTMPGMDHSMPGMDHSMPGMDETSGPVATSAQQPLGPDTADLTYPLYLVNGRTPTHPAAYPVRAGEQVRLRLINAGASTPFRVAFGGGRMTVVATDGYPVEPVRTDALLIGMGERYDVLVTVPGNGVYPLVAAAEGQNDQALAVLRSGAGALPPADVHPAQLDAAPLTSAGLHATPDVALAAGSPRRTYRATMTGTMMTFDWGLRVPERGGATLPVKAGERVRMVLANDTMMWHPMHLHGHTFQVVTADGTGPRKDTVVVAPHSSVTVEFIADNPGQWMVHCHNLYHAEAGMMTMLSYVR